MSVYFFWLQKVSRKLRLSKTKNTKFNDSGILLPFYFFFAAWGADIILKVKQYICVHYEMYLYAWYSKMMETSNLVESKKIFRKFKWRTFETHAQGAQHKTS